MRKTHFFLLALVFFVSACKQDEANVPEAIRPLVEQYKKDKTEKNGQALLSGIFAEAQKEGAASEDLYEVGIQYADELKNANFKSACLHSLIKDYPDSPKTPDRLEQLIDVMQNDFHRANASLALKRGYITSFPEGKMTSKYQESMPAFTENIDSFIYYIGKRIVDDSTKAFNPEYAREYVNVAEGLVLAHPKFDRSADYLFNAAKTANTIKDYSKALVLYDWVMEKYPEHPMAGKSLFMKAFVFDSKLKNTESASKYYADFIKRYPNDELADDAQFLLDNIGISEDELLKRIQDKQVK